MATASLASPPQFGPPQLHGSIPIGHPESKQQALRINSKRLCAREGRLVPLIRECYRRHRARRKMVWRWRRMEAAEPSSVG